MSDNKEALRVEILKYLEKHSRVDLGELAVLMGAEEAEVANEMAEMEKEKIDITEPSKGVKRGALHPLTRFNNKFIELKMN